MVFTRVLPESILLLAFRQPALTQLRLEVCCSLSWAVREWVQRLSPYSKLLAGGGRWSSTLLLTFYF